jgi:hypothetical protein
VSTSEQHSRGNAWNRQVDPGLRTQVRIFLAIFLVTVALTIERVIARDVNPLWAALGLGSGMAIGAALAMTHRA